AEPPIAAYSRVRDLASNAFNDILDNKPVEDTFSALNADANAEVAKNPPGAPLPTPLPTKVPTAAATQAKSPFAHLTILSRPARPGGQANIFKLTLVHYKHCGYNDAKRPN